MTRAAVTGRAENSAEDARLARLVVATLGGRYSTELGIDVDAGDAQVERWFLAATLFGTRISAAIAERTFRVLSDAGLARIGQARHIPEEDLIAYLDEGGYARYDFRTATRLQALSGVIGERYDGQVAVIGQRLKLSGMHWSAAGADAITTLRCQQASRPEDRICNTLHNQTAGADLGTQAS